MSGSAFSLSSSASIYFLISVCLGVRQIMAESSAGNDAVVWLHGGFSGGRIFVRQVRCKLCWETFNFL